MLRDFTLEEQAYIAQLVVARGILAEVAILHKLLPSSFSDDNTSVLSEFESLFHRSEEPARAF